MNSPWHVSSDSMSQHYEAICLINTSVFTSLIGVKWIITVIAQSGLTLCFALGGVCLPFLSICTPSAVYPWYWILDFHALHCQLNIYIIQHISPSIWKLCTTGGDSKEQSYIFFLVCKKRNSHGKAGTRPCSRRVWQYSIFSYSQRIN